MLPWLSPAAFAYITANGMCDGRCATQVQNDQFARDHLIKNSFPFLFHLLSQFKFTRGLLIWVCNNLTYLSFCFVTIFFRGSVLCVTTRATEMRKKVCPTSFHERAPHLSFWSITTSHPPVFPVPRIASTGAKRNDSKAPTENMIGSQSHTTLYKRRG